VVLRERVPATRPSEIKKTQSFFYSVPN